MSDVSEEEFELPEIDELEAQLEEVGDSRAPVEKEEKPNHLNTFRAYLGVVMQHWFKTPGRIFATLCLVIGCLITISWNLNRLSVFDRLLQVESDQYSFYSKLEMLKLEQAALDIDNLELQIEEENERVFQGFPELAAWVEGAAGLAENQQMTFAYTVGSSAPSSVPGVLEVSLKVSMRSQAADGGKLFANGMHLVHRMLSGRWHIDVLGARGMGNGSKMESLELDLVVWVSDRYGFVDLVATDTAAEPTSTLDF